MKFFKNALLFSFILLILSCSEQNQKSAQVGNSELAKVELLVLGIAQDAGYPQISCRKECCQKFYSNKVKGEQPTSLALIDRESHKIWIFEASPSFREQWRLAQDFSAYLDKDVPDGIFLSHAHIGHYTGLMQLGHEALGAKDVQVFAMPRMKEFLSNNGPWDQLLSHKNINIQPIDTGTNIRLSKNCSVEAIKVPHRDEYSETVGFRIFGPSKSVLFIPDIDKWEKWEKDISNEISKVDFALLDGTFFGDGELAGRDMSLVPHPFISESMTLFSGLSSDEKSKIHFIHFNHSNPMLWSKDHRNSVLENGFRLAETKMTLALD